MRNRVGQVTGKELREKIPQQMYSVTVGFKNENTDYKRG